MAEGTVAFVDRIGASQLGLLASLEQRGILGVARSHEDRTSPPPPPPRHRLTVSPPR
jgi:hypothetical protein